MCGIISKSGVRLVGEKDITEKQLLELEDVFADIVNVLLLDGKPLILPEELKPATKDSPYKDKDLKMRMQERDIAKLWVKENVRLAFFGLEDQTAIDYDMPLRISQMRKTGKWKPMPGEVKHIKELFDLFSVVTKDNRFIEIYQEAKGEVGNMACVALDYLMEETKAKWRDEEKDETMLNSIRNLMKNLKLTAVKAMDALSIPPEDRKRYADRI